MIIRALAGISLLICLIVPFLFFWGQISQAGYRTALALGTLAWFVLATAAMTRRTRPGRSATDSQR